VKTLETVQGVCQDWCNVPGSVSLFDDLFIKIASDLKPQSVLDVGAGAGKYADLLRGILPECNIEAVEPEASYITTYNLHSKYNKIYNKDIKRFLEEDLLNNKVYDLVIFGDVLEHLYLNDAMNVLNSIYYCSKKVIVQFPTNVPQNDYGGVKWEVHRCNLSLNDFSRYDVRYYVKVPESTNYWEMVHHNFLLLQMMHP
jgi:trans-aconitate methyltransferase